MAEHEGGPVEQIGSEHHSAGDSERARSPGAVTESQEIDQSAGQGQRERRHEDRGHENAPVHLVFREHGVRDRGGNDAEEAAQRRLVGVRPPLEDRPIPVAGLGSEELESLSDLERSPGDDRLRQAVPARVVGGDRDVGVSDRDEQRAADNPDKERILVRRSRVRGHRESPVVGSSFFFGRCVAVSCVETTS